VVGLALRSRSLPLVAAFLLSVACAGGEPGSGFSSVTFGPPGTTDASDSSPPGTSGGTGDPDTGVMTSNGSGVDPDDSGTGPGPGTGPDPDAGCVPEAEVCNGEDDDCDTVADNGDPGSGEDCNTGMSGVCAAGTTACEAGAIACNPSVAPQAESCNGLDDDCNGEADDGNPGGGGACNTGMAGVCSAGTNQCTGGALGCVANVAPSAETCNNADDDCNGVIDNGNPGGGGACNTGLPGVCGPGTLACVGGGLSCQQNQGAAPDETCGNGLDDDCNGQVDDGCGGGPCPFGLCTAMGIPQVNGCDPCVTQVCAVDGFCCTNSWDAVCVGEVESVCGRADCVSASCAHLVCVSGGALAAGCHPCVTNICAVDAFCCSNSWDGVCVGEVGSVCGLTCP
jgi:Notch-like protein